MLQQARAKRQKIQPLRPHLILDHLQDHQLVQELTSHQEIWVLADLQFSVQHVANIHTGEGNAHMIIIVQHVKIMTMLHTCVGLTDKASNNQGQQGQRSPQICIYCGSIEHSSSNCQRRPWNNREQPHDTPESLRRDQQANSHVSGRAAPMGANN